MTAAAVAPIVAIINDDETYQDMWSIQVEEAGYQPYVVHRPAGRAFASVEELANEVENHAQYAVFDHRLAQRDLAQFTGAEIVAALYERRRTAPLLVTTFEKIDKDTTIRADRRKVPVLLSSADFDNPETIGIVLMSAGGKFGTTTYRSSVVVGARWCRSKIAIKTQKSKR